MCIYIYCVSCNLFYNILQPSGPPQENLNALQRAIDSMEEKGLQEDPRYSQLLALRARQGNMEPNQRPPSSMQVSSISVLICVLICTCKLL